MADKASIAKAYESGLFTQKEIADKVDKSQSYVSNVIAEIKKEQEIENLKSIIREKERIIDSQKIQLEKIHFENEFMKLVVNSRNENKERSIELKDCEVVVED